MKVLVIGASGTIGQAVAAELGARHEILSAGQNSGQFRVDIKDLASVQALFHETRKLDAVVVAAGSLHFGPLADMTPEQFNIGLQDKLMGQVNVARLALETGVVRDGGSITLTSGVLAQQPMPGSAAISLINAGVEGFARAAALEAPRGIRVNVVSPGWVSETLAAMGRDPSAGVPAAAVAQVYVASVEGSGTGLVMPALPG